MTVVIEGLQAWEIEHVSGIQSAVDEGDAAMFRMARRVVEAREAGMTQQRIADNLRKPSGDTYSRPWVAHVEKALSYHDNNPDDSWAECWDHALGRGAHVANNAGDNEWYTPAPYVEAAREVMGGIDLDPASSVAANEVVRANRFFTEEDNGLVQVWEADSLWMNPPYARPRIDEFCGKLAEDYSAHNVKQAITLTNNATETGWFHALAEVGSAMCFPRQRVKFWHPDKESAPLQGQAVVYLGDNVEAFRARFVEFGFTVML